MRRFVLRANEEPAIACQPSGAMRKLSMAIALLAVLVLSTSAHAAAVAGTMPVGEACLEPQTPPNGIIHLSPNVEHLGSLMGEAGAMDAGGRVVGHYFYVTGATHFSIYDVSDPAKPKLTSRVDFPCRFENEDVAVNGDYLIYSDFATTGDLYVYDIRDKSKPKLVSDTPAAGTHTAECIDDCRYLYGSYTAVGPVGPLSGGKVVDLADPAKPKDLGDWTDNGVLESRKVHDVTEVSPGRIITASAPIEYLDISGDKAKPKVLARSDTPADHRFHTAIWPRGGEDRFMLAMYETNGTPRCEAGSGEFAVFDATQWSVTGKFKPLSTFYLSNGDFEDGNPPANPGLGCSPHWFNVRPSWNDGGVVAMGAYDHGAKFLRIDSAGKVSEIGHFLAPGTNASGAYWVTCDIVYVVDYTRGVDVLRFKDPATACPAAGSDAPTGGVPTSGQPTSGQPTETTPNTVAPKRCRTKRSFRIRLPRNAKSAKVVVGGRRAKVTRHRRLTALVRLRGRRGAVVKVRIRMVLRNGRTTTQTRRYRICP
jgi:hypothetical protein